jgi:hypothetical protein
MSRVGGGANVNLLDRSSKFSLKSLSILHFALYSQGFSHSKSKNLILCTLQNIHKHCSSNHVMEHQRPRIELFGNARIWRNFSVGEEK